MVRAKWQRIKHPTSKLQKSIQEKRKFKKRIESLLFSYLSNNLTFSSGETYKKAIRKRNYEHYFESVTHVVELSFAVHVIL